ncbi:D-alanyl-D-alanine carboxypeptidase/D-alanyl-D-alanine-endopeptidase [Spirochaetia bacterium]|nr:D-alanyl-D-alanine carboxypeptidase/D-alanyl-D-alanine-endopeptidase [Spirochaetia bacterium]
MLGKPGKFLPLLLIVMVVSCITEKSAQKFHKQAEVYERIQEITSRPEFNGAHWGMKFYTPDTGEILYSLNEEDVFNPASSMKIFTAGTVYESLGKDYRFHTPVYRTGPVENGILKGDLVVKASGDLLLGGRINSDGTLNLPETDHTYDMSATAVPVSDDPLRSIRILAEQIAENGIKGIEGIVIVDNTLFQEGTDSLGGTGEHVISPMMINDNIVDIVVSPGKTAGSPAGLQIIPETPYVTIINKVTTVEKLSAPGPGGPPNNMLAGKPQFVDDILNGDGSHTVTLTGEIVLGSSPTLCTYRIPEPARFAEAVLCMLLKEKGISVNVDLKRKHDFSALSGNYTPENKIAEIVSPSLTEELFPMMKLSSNLHTAAWPYIVGAIAGGKSENARLKGFEIQKALYERTGVEVDVDTANLHKIADAGYSPKSFINFLEYLYNTPYFSEFKKCLPVMGVDGTLSDIDPALAAAGHVYAKTGTGLRMTRRLGDERPSVSIVKALAGFLLLPNGRIVMFAEFVDYDTDNPDTTIAHQAMSEIANVIYEALM